MVREVRKLPPRTKAAILKRTLLVLLPLVLLLVGVCQRLLLRATTTPTYCTSVVCQSINQSIYLSVAFNLCVVLSPSQSRNRLSNIPTRSTTSITTDASVSSTISACFSWRILYVFLIADCPCYKYVRRGQAPSCTILSVSSPACRATCSPFCCAAFRSRCEGGEAGGRSRRVEGSTAVTVVGWFQYSINN